MSSRKKTTTREPTTARHPQLYFPDGDIVLSASKRVYDSEHNATTTVVLFRVYEAVLTYHSQVLQDLLSNLSAKEARETYDGVLRVNLPDHADDLEALLGALYNLSMLRLDPLDPNLPLLVQGTLILANKYQVTTVTKAICACLMEAWPRTVGEWDSRQNLISYTAEECKRDRNGKTLGKYLNELFSEPGSALGLALKCAVPEIIPAAMYQLALIDPENNWDNMPEQKLRAGARGARWDCVPKSALLCVMRGRERLLKAQSRQLNTNFTRAKDCNSDCCDDSWSLEAVKLRTIDVLAEMKLVEKKIWAVSDICQRCRFHAVAVMRARREAYWAALTKLFELNTL
ncbi:hypothetical protein EIP86_002061 [Pleurotus ostreatoroseus]|nr:hypothetical protein EIP86_002061 [Pleurotus ostreatoroseus]